MSPVAGQQALQGILEAVGLQRIVTRVQPSPAGVDAVRLLDCDRRLRPVAAEACAEPVRNQTFRSVQLLRKRIDNGKDGVRFPYSARIRVRERDHDQKRREVRVIHQHGLRLVDDVLPPEPAEQVPGSQ